MGRDQVTEYARSIRAGNVFHREMSPTLTILYRKSCSRASASFASNPCSLLPRSPNHHSSALAAARGLVETYQADGVGRWLNLSSEAPTTDETLHSPQQRVDDATVRLLRPQKNLALQDPSDA